MASAEYPKINSVFQRDGHGRFTDVYACPEFEYLAGLPWAWTEKVDGINIRLHLPGDGKRDVWATSAYQLVTGRTDNAQIPPKLLAACAGILERVLVTDVFAPDADVVLYGEGYGAGIQKGGQYRPDPDFVLFDVRVGDWWLTRPNVEDVAAKLQLDVVPVVATATLVEAVESMREMAAGSRVMFESAWQGARPEGIVGRPAVDLWNRRGDRIITKLKFRDFRR
jgi:hypothetical protein